MIQTDQSTQVSQLISAVNADPTLSQEEKQQLLQFVSRGDVITRLAAGALGAALALRVSKFLKLSKPAQVLLAIGGYGIGRLLLNTIQKQPSNFADYNSKLKVYEINQRTN